MRTLQIEELELVAGGAPDVPLPAVYNSQSKENNGLGNGNQVAPGNSLEHNGAENNVNGESTGNPPGEGFFPVIPN